MKTLQYILNKYNITVGRQYLIDVEGMVGSAALSKLFAELKFNKGVEVGVDRGYFSEVLCKDNPNLHLYGVDPWMYGTFPEGNPYRMTQRYFDGCYEEAVKRLAQYNCTIIKRTSMDALSEFEDNSLDFVYIDANHSEPFISQDITEWYKKLKVGGILSGHDYIQPARRGRKDFVCNVIDATQRFTKEKNIRPWFILGLKSKENGIVRDSTRSWMWVKV